MGDMRKKLVRVGLAGLQVMRPDRQTDRQTDKHTHTRSQYLSNLLMPRRASESPESEMTSFLF